MHHPQLRANVLLIRAITPADKPALAAFFAGLTPLSQSRRFLTSKPRLSTRELAYFTEIDHRRHVALVALNALEEIVAVTHYAGWPGGAGAAEMAIAVADDHQRCGLGTALGLLLIERARANEVDRLTATTQPDNLGCLGLLRRLGFTRRGYVDGLVETDLTLSASGWQPGGGGLIEQPAADVRARGDGDLGAGGGVVHEAGLEVSVVLLSGRDRASDLAGAKHERLFSARQGRRSRTPERVQRHPA